MSKRAANDHFLYLANEEEGDVFLHHQCSGSVCLFYPFTLFFVSFIRFNPGLRFHGF